MAERPTANVPSSPRKRGSSDFQRDGAKTLDSRLRGNDGQKATLHNRIHVKHGYPFKSEHFADEGKYIVLTPGNFWEAGGFKLQLGKEKFYDAEFPPEYLHECGDLIIAMTEQSAGLLGSMAFVPESDRYLHNQRIGKVTATSDDVHLGFLYYAFRLQSVRTQLSNTASGSKVRHTSPERIYNVSLPLPSIADQRKIASFLSTLDAKIDLNNRINAELEALAKTIYDYWFVQFDFPDVHGRPYKSSGGAMVWNDTLKREIPAGWEVKALSELGSFRNGINYDPSVGGDVTARIVNVRNVSASTVFLKQDSFDELALNQADIDRYLVTPDAILIARSGIPGATRMMQPCPPNTIYCGFIICLTVADAENKLTLFFRLKQLEQSLLSQSSGSILKNVSQDTLKEIRLAMSRDKSAIERFNAALNPLFTKISANEMESSELTRLRDWLLPLLMNGQVRVRKTSDDGQEDHRDLNGAADRLPDTVVA